jgi:hypothetical protein
VPATSAAATSAAATSVSGFRHDVVLLGRIRRGDRPGCPGPAEGRLMASAEAAARTACARRSPPVRSCPAPPCWCPASTWRRPTPPTCSRTLRGAIGYLLKNRVAKVEEFLDAWTGSPAARRCSTPGDCPAAGRAAPGQRPLRAVTSLAGRVRPWPVPGCGHRAASGRAGVLRLPAATSSWPRRREVPGPRRVPRRARSACSPGYRLGAAGLHRRARGVARRARWRTSGRTEPGALLRPGDHLGAPTRYARPSAVRAGPARPSAAGRSPNRAPASPVAVSR